MPHCVARILRTCCLLASHSRLSCCALPPQAAPLCRRLLPRPSPPRTQHCTAAARRMSSACAAAGGPAMAEAKAALVAAIARGREVPTLQVGVRRACPRHHGNGPASLAALTCSPTPSAAARAPLADESAPHGTPGHPCFVARCGTRRGHSGRAHHAAPACMQAAPCHAARASVLPQASDW
jgi:hypothetical protein